MKDFDENQSENKTNEEFNPYFHSLLIHQFEKNPKTTPNGAIKIPMILKIVNVKSGFKLICANLMIFSTHNPKQRIPAKTPNNQKISKSVNPDCFFMYAPFLFLRLSSRLLFSSTSTNHILPLTNLFH